MRQAKLVSLAILLFASASLAQDKLLTIDDIFGLDAKVRVNFSGTPARLAWSSDGRSFRQVRDGALVRVNAVTGDITPYIDTARFAAALQGAGMSEAMARTTANSINLHFNKSETAVLVTHSADLWHYDVPSGTLRRLTNSKEEEVEADYSPDGKWVSFVRGKNLFVVDIARARE